MRCAAGEALGRISQVVSDSKFVAETAQNSFDFLKTARDVISRTGHSLALGCLHRYVGGMGSAQHLHTSVSILLALSQDSASPEVQVWSLHALALIADSGGPMFRGFVEPTLSTTLKLLLSVQSTSLEVLSCLGRVLSALITTSGARAAIGHFTLEGLLHHRLQHHSGASAPGHSGGGDFVPAAVAHVLRLHHGPDQVGAQVDFAVEELAFGVATSRGVVLEAVVAETSEGSL